MMCVVQGWEMSLIKRNEIMCIMQVWVMSLIKCRENGVHYVGVGNVSNQV